MQLAKQGGGLLAIILAVLVAGADDPTPAAVMAGLKKERMAAFDALRLKQGTAEG